MPFVAATDASDDDKKRADYVCDGVADDVEIQAAINGSPCMLQRAFEGEQWLDDAKSHWTACFQAVEERLVTGLGWVQLDRENRKTFSLQIASILRDAGSAFGSVLDVLVKGSDVSARRRGKYEILDYCDLLRREIPDVYRRSVTLRSLHPAGVVVPLEDLRVEGRAPGWWTAHNRVKHQEAVALAEGNLENAVTAICALALLGYLLGAFSADSLFVNVGIAYPDDSIDMSDERRLFPRSTENDS